MPRFIKIYKGADFNNTQISYATKNIPIMLIFFNRIFRLINNSNVLKCSNFSGRVNGIQFIYIPNSGLLYFSS